MFTLIMREIEDNRVFFMATIILAAVLSILVVWGEYGENGGMELVGVLLGFWVLTTFAFCGMGTAQMYWDRTRKVSAFLATLAVSRNQIFAARVAAGVLLVLAGLVPVWWTIIAVVSSITRSSVIGQGGLYPGMFIPVFLAGIGSYCIGLQAGWTSNKVAPTLGALGLNFVFLSIISVKGFGWEICAILAVFIAACLIRAWRIFSTAAF